MALDSIDLHVGNPEMDRGHEDFALLLERANTICPCPDWSCDCIRCPREKVQKCGAEMLSFADELMIALLKHFEEEEVLMASLAKSRHVKTHCAKHRTAHASFSTKFNKIIVTLDTDDVVESIGKLESFVVTWVREHILRFDGELASLLSISLNEGNLP